MVYQYKIYNVTTGQYISPAFSSSSNVITMPNGYNGTYLGYIYHTSWDAAINQYYSGSVDGSSTTVTVPSSYPYIVFFVSTGTATTYEAYAYLPFSSDGSADLPKINSWTTAPSSISAPTYDGYICKGYVIGSDLYDCVSQYTNDGITVALTVCNGSALSTTYPCVMFVYVQISTTYTSWQTPTQIASIGSGTTGLSNTTTIGCYQAGYIKYRTPSYTGKLVCKTTSGLTSPDFCSYLADELLSAGSDPDNRQGAVEGDSLLIYDDDGGDEGYDTEISYESDGDETYYWYVNAEFQSSGSYSVPWQLNYYKRYTISYSANGGSMTSTTTKFYDDTYRATLTNTKPTRSGYKFLGWSTSSTATTAGYQSGGTYIFDPSNQYLYAVWQKANYVLTYDANEGKNAPSSVTFSDDLSITINTTSYPTRTGYVFKGWATSNSTNIPTYKKDVSYTATFSNSITLYAIWWPEWVWDNHSITEANNINQYVNTYCGTTNNTDITPGTIYLWQWIQNIAEVLGGYEKIKNQKIVSNSTIEILKTYYEQF